MAIVTRTIGPGQDHADPMAADAYLVANANPGDTVGLNAYTATYTRVGGNGVYEPAFDVDNGTVTFQRASATEIPVLDGELARSGVYLNQKGQYTFDGINIRRASVYGFYVNQADNFDVTVENCRVASENTGVYLAGASSADFTLDSNQVIARAAGFWYGGVYSGNVLVEKNIFTGMVYGIYNNQTALTGTFIIRDNLLCALNSPINIFGHAADNSGYEIYRNMIPVGREIALRRLTSPTFYNNVVVFGANNNGYLFVYDVDGLECYYNTFIRFASYLTGCIHLSGTGGTGSPNATIKNNLILNYSANERFYIDVTGDSQVGFDSDYNALVAYGTAAGFNWGGWAAALKDLATWIVDTGHDANSQYIKCNEEVLWLGHYESDLPLFNSQYFYRPRVGSPIYQAGTPIVGYTTDFLGETRDGTNPSIGAFEETWDGSVAGGIGQIRLLEV